MSQGGVVSRRKALAAAGAFLVTAACDSEKLFGPAKPRTWKPGVSTFTGWASPRPEYGRVPGVQCPLEYPWQGMLASNRVPAIGQYNEADPSVSAWRLQQMERAGIEWTTYQHEWSFHERELTMNHCAENHPDDARVQFAMSWWDVLAAATDPLNLTYWDSTYRLNGTIPVWTRESVSASLVAYGKACEPFFRKASYLRIGDRPVLFRGSAHSLRFYARFGLSPKDVLDLISSELPERPYFVATGTDPEVYRDLKSWGFDAFTEYALYSDSYEHVRETYRSYWESSLRLARETGLHFWVPALAGFDARGYLPDSEASKLGYFEPRRPADFTDHLSEARAVAESNHDVTQGRCLVYAWSEFYEGGIIEPLAAGGIHAGDEMLLAFKAAA